MRIAHISDLHFGKHHSLLMANLKERLAKLKPDVIVCSGDVADDTSEDLTEDARLYLDELSRCCEPGHGPRFIVVPGNHDVRKKGWLYRSFAQHYAQAFGDKITDYYYEPENVWVFGFDSAKEGEAFGGGFISDEELGAFHARYEALARNEKFSQAFKIVVVHHHPLPVNWDHTAATKWLTMVDAGKFLSAVLFRRIDLVLHGHEHLQARARLWSSLGANDHQTTVVSLGSTLKKLSAPDRNWFGLIDIDGNGVRLNFYPSVGSAFSDKPDGETFWVRSPQSAEDRVFERWRDERGLFYRALASVTMLDRDGDSRRSIECDDLTFLRTPADWRSAVTIVLPHTSGDIDRLVVTGTDGPRVETPLPTEGPLHDFAAPITFNTLPTVSRPTDLVVGWHTLNSYAMDRRQFDHMYGGGDGQPLDNVEFTHYVVNEPIEQLTVVARFPEGFTPIKPRLRVARADATAPTRTWKNVPDVEESLNDQYVLRFYESIRIAAMRVRRPKMGLSYGIQWELPEPERRMRDQASIEIESIVQQIFVANDTQRAQMSGVLQLLIESSRKLLMPTGPRGKSGMGRWRRASWSSMPLRTRSGSWRRSKTIAGP